MSAQWHTRRAGGGLAGGVERVGGGGVWGGHGLLSLNFAVLRRSAEPARP